MKLKINFMGRLQGFKAEPCLRSGVTGVSPNPPRFYALPRSHSTKIHGDYLCNRDL
jgi:hypothetical protein